MKVDEAGQNEIEMMRTDAVYFVETMLGANPTSQQKEILEAYSRGDNRISARSGHGIGKSSVLAWIVLHHGLFKQDAKTLMTAPTSPQLYQLLIPEVGKWWARVNPAFSDMVEVTSEKVKFNNGNVGIARTARRETPEALQGFHADHLLVLVDEASGVPDSIYEVLEGAVTGGQDNIMILTGNPTRRGGYFFDSHNRNKKFWTTMHFSSKDSSNVSPDWLQGMKNKWGEGSDVYRVRVEGNFPDQNSTAMFSFNMLEKAAAIEVPHKTTGEVILGVDVARFGSDKTVIAVRQGKHFIRLDVHDYDTDAVHVAGLVQEAARKYKASRVVVDDIGVGGGAFDILKTFNPTYALIAGNVSNRATKDEYYNMRSQIYHALHEYIEDGGHIPNDDQLLTELSVVERKFNISGGKIQLAPKADIKALMGGVSPDLSDAVALTFFAGSIPEFAVFGATI